MSLKFCVYGTQGITNQSEIKSSHHQTFSHVVLKFAAIERYKNIFTIFCVNQYMDRNLHVSKKKKANKITFSYC